MSVETLKLLSVVCFILFGVLFIGCIVLFFVLKINSVISELTGRTQKKAIEKIRLKNSKGRTNAIESGELSAKLSSVSNSFSSKKNITVKLTANNVNTTVLDTNSADTVVISDNQLNESFNENETNNDYTDEPQAYGFYILTDIVLCESKGIE